MHFTCNFVSSPESAQEKSFSLLPLQKMIFTPPSALKVYDPYIRHESVESTFLVAFILKNRGARFVMVDCRQPFSMGGYQPETNYSPHIFNMNFVFLNFQNLKTSTENLEHQ